MGRTGRKRKAGPRNKGGRLVEDKNDDWKLAALQPHRRWLPAHMRLDQRAETPFGCLNLIGVIDNEYFLAGEKYAIIVASYRSTIEGPNPNPKSISGLREIGRTLNVVTDEAMAARKKRYDDAFEAILSAGHDAARIVSRVVIHRETCSAEEIPRLRAGLHELAVHFEFVRSKGHEARKIG